MYKLVLEENLKGAFPYLDHIRIAGSTQKEHDRNVKNFLKVVEQKTVNSTSQRLSGPCIPSVFEDIVWGMAF